MALCFDPFTAGKAGHNDLLARDHSPIEVELLRVQIRAILRRNLPGLNVGSDLLR
jgi:hypothetical protein